MKLTQTTLKMYMANAKILRLVLMQPIIIPLTHVGGFALADAKNLRYPMQEIPTCWYFLHKVTQKYYLLR